MYGYVMPQIKGRAPAEWIARATLAYYASDTTTDVDLSRSTVEEFDGLYYVALRDTSSRVLAWYRVQNVGQLRRMVRGPKGGR